LSLSDFCKNYLKLSLTKLIDPDEQFYNTKEELNEMTKQIRTVAINVDTGGTGDFDLASRGLVFDRYCEGLAIGSSGRISSWQRETESPEPLIIRGLGKSGQEAIKKCWETGRDFYAIDTGYLQIANSLTKTYNRVTKNNLQNLGPIVKRPDDRLKKLNWKMNKAPTGSDILICAPSEKIMKFYGVDLEKWLTETVEEIKKYSDRPIVIREKPTRHDRVTTNTIWQALDTAYCLVTFNSIAATEAFLYGVPAIALAPNAASVVCNTNISDIEVLSTPSEFERTLLAKHLSYCQFTLHEMRSGYAWKIVNEGS
jgi:hypothetical protein